MIQCIQCSSEIPANWVYILKNGGPCPACGGDIYDEQSKNLIEEITRCLEEMPNNPAGIAGWLLTNYRISRIGETAPEPVEFYGQPKKRQGQAELPDNGNDFLRRAGVDKNKMASIQNKYRNIVEEIESSQNHMYGGDESESEFQVPENYTPTAEDMAIMQNAMPFGQAKLAKKASIAQQTGPLNQDDLEQFKAAMEEDAIKATKFHPAVEAERMRRLARQEANSSTYTGGGGSGKDIRIRRAGSD